METTILLPAAIAIICKAPIPGLSKTRLIPALGAERAAELSRAFLCDLCATIEAVRETHGAQGYAVCSPESARTILERFMPASFDYLVETGPLGQVLDETTRRLLERGHQSAILVNGDSPTLPAALLARAVEVLREDPDAAVFAPALDGGYTFVGLARRAPELFADIPWSTPEVMSLTLERARDAGIRVEVLSPWYDVDDAASLDWLRAELGGHPPADLRLPGADAPHTRRILARDD